MQIPNGYHDLPAGKIASIVTYLEMSGGPARPPSAAPEGMGLEPRPKPDSDWYRQMFRAIGEPWLWFSRALMPEEKLLALIHDPLVEIFVLRHNGRDAGLFELDRREPPDVELAFFGLIPEAIGKGAGRYLIHQAIARAFTHQPPRFWLHTCTLDHPRALEFYQKAGFRPYKRQVEIADDPRISGYLPRTAGTAFPIL